MTEEINKIIDKLIELGEDKDELEYWRAIYDDLPPDQQKQIHFDFIQELLALGVKEI